MFPGFNDDQMHASIKVYWKQLGGHIHCRVFTTALVGELIFSENEWAMVQRAWGSSTAFLRELSDNEALDAISAAFNQALQRLPVHQPNDKQHHDDNQQHVQRTAHGVGRDHTEQPHDENDDQKDFKHW